MSEGSDTFRRGLTSGVPPLGLRPVCAVIERVGAALVATALTNAIDIIAGFNGLASMGAFMMFASLGFVAFQVSDPIVRSASFMMTLCRCANTLAPETPTR
jgi:UDP-N-acetylmuramyl pentapeptide phosphotransferase/UDP-N-acetylglucosamine-1-phosphate transferase